MPLGTKKKSALRSKPDPAFILERIMHFCSYRERSVRETEMKLKSMKTDPRRIPAILMKLADEGFLDDARFARSFTGGKWRINRWGKVKIAYELRANGIPEKLIREALEQIAEEEYIQVLSLLIRKKAGELGWVPDEGGKSENRAGISSAVKKRKRILPAAGDENNSREKFILKDKIVKFALGKGYEPDLVYELLREIKL